MNRLARAIGPSTRSIQDARKSPAVQDDRESADCPALPCALVWCHSISEPLKTVNREIELQLRSEHDSLTGMLNHVARLGGKRLRPALLLLSAQVFGPPSEEAIKLAVVVELLHTATLLHDDVLDGATLRRSITTVHEAFGKKCGIVLGDFLFTKAYRLAATCHSTYPAQLVASCATQLCEGELRQQTTVGCWNMGQDEYFDILRQKTAELCAACCRLGAWTGRSMDDHAEKLERFGRYLGIAFQVMDDWLDIWGTDSVGKSLGTDLIQRKPTLPMIRLLQSVGEVERASIVEALNENSAQAHLEVLEKLKRSDASDYTLGTARDLIELAKRSLDTLPLGNGVSSLCKAADQVVQRSS